MRFALSQWATVLYCVCLLILGEGMPQLARFQLDNGTYFEAELDESAFSGKVMRGGISAPDILAESNRTFQAAIGNVKAAAEAMVDGLRSLAKPADAVSLEFGVKLTAETGAVIAKASADAHFVVKLEWKKAHSVKD